MRSVPCIIPRYAECNPGQVVYTRASVTKQYNFFYTSQWAVMLDDWQGNRGLAEK